MYVCEPNEYNEMNFFDRLSGTDMVLFYAMPDTKTITAFENAVIAKKQGKMLRNLSEARQKYGREILMGFKTGCFGVPYDEFYQGAPPEVKENLEKYRLTAGGPYRLKDDIPELEANGRTYHQWDLADEPPQGHETSFQPVDMRYLPYASDNQSPWYLEDWKDRVCKARPDIIKALAQQVFESSVEVGETSKN
jgi:hypothetical protein